jgi:uncharacterized protein DUF1569
MKNLFEPATAQEVKQRMAQLGPENERLWGKMNAAQAQAHCSIALEWALGNAVPARANLLGRIMGRIVKPLVFRNNDPLRRNSPTAKELIVEDDRDLKKEQDRLSGLVDRFASAGPEGCTKHPHTFFGPLTPQEWATLMYKHLDHHLRQFGV